MSKIFNIILKAKRASLEDESLESVVIYDAYGMPVPKGTKNYKKMTLIFEDPTENFKKSLHQRKLYKQKLKSSKLFNELCLIKL